MTSLNWHHWHPHITDGAEKRSDVSYPREHGHQTQSWGLNLALLRARWLICLCCTECNEALPRFPFYLCFRTSILLPWKPAVYVSSQTELHLICISQLCFLLCPQQKVLPCGHLHILGRFSGENTDSWDQKLVGEYFPTLSVHILGKAFEVCSMWFSDGPQVGQSPGIPSGTQLQ